MLKKNIAKAMAAATVFTAVAPTAFAAQGRAVIENAQEKEVKELKENVYNLLNTRYTENTAILGDANRNSIAGEVVYQVKVNGGNAVSSYSEFEKEFDKAFSSLKAGDRILVSYESKHGFNKLEDGEIVDVDYPEYAILNDGTNEIDNLLKASTSGSIAEKIEKYLGEKASVIPLEDGSKEGKLPISNGEFITVKIGDTKLSKNKPKFKVVDGHYVDGDGNPIKVFDGSDVFNLNTIDELIALGGVVEGYYPVTGSSATEAKKDKGTFAIVKSYEATTKEDLTVGDLYEASTTRLTVKGNEIRKAMIDVLNDENGSVVGKNNIDNIKFKIITTTNAGKETVIADSETVNGSTKTISGLIADVKTASKYDNVKSVKIIFYTIGDENDDKLEWAPVYEATITEGRNEKFLTLATVLCDDANVKTLAGTDRYKTAVEVSKATYADADALKNDTVVLVSGDANKLVDGLTATPLAAVLDAPILLTQSGAINEDTLKEIKRLEAKKVVIVGGDSAINESVENELKKVHALDVTRLSGDSRYETSMAVANKIASLKTPQGKTSAELDEVFVVGGNGEADALSAAAIAAKKGTPILLTPATKLDADVKNFINKNVTDKTNAVDVYVVGGSNSVNSSVQADLVKINVNNSLNNNIEVKRLAGEGRQETNAAVITEFKSSLEDIVVAKSDNKGMVDALAAGAYAAKKNSHIVLATNSLTEAQEDAIAEVKKANTTKTNTLVQAGYNVGKAAVAGIIAKIAR